MTPEELKQLLDKYKSANCTPDELLIIDRFFKATEDKNILVFKDDLDQNTIQFNLKAKIDEKIENRQNVVRTPFKFVRFYKMAAAAVLVIGVIGLAFYLNIYQSINSSQDLASYQTLNRQKQDIVLEDGTKVYLNSGSTFKAPKAFSGEKRLVYLTGEAFFEVAKNDRMPFIIISNQLTTQVVGTSFNVKAYEDSDNIEIAVMTGKVKVFDAVSEVFLTPNQKVIYEKSAKTLQKQDISEVNNYNAWMNGSMVFEKKSMEEIVSDLNRHFDVEIKLDGEKMKKCVLNIRFENDSLETVLQILCSYTDAKYTRNGSSIVITGKGC